MILTMMGGGWWAYLWRERERVRANIQDIMLVKKNTTLGTFQTMHNNIHLPIHQQPLQLLRPNTFRIKFRKRLDLILVGHGTDYLHFVLWSRRSCLQLRDYHFCLGNGKLGFSCADGDDFLTVVVCLEGVVCWRKDGVGIRHGGRGVGMW